MTEKAIRRKFQQLERAAKRDYDRPTVMRMAEKDGEVVGVEIRSDHRSLWKWPKGYRSGLSVEPPAFHNNPMAAVRYNYPYYASMGFIV